METFFGVPWREVELEHVKALLSEAIDEGLTWEAKGTERPRPDAVRKHCCGFANAMGGFLIVGARRDDATWVVDGVDFRGDEPKLWLGNVIRDGLAPAPWHEIHAWRVEDGRYVAVVRIDQVSAGPCMTASGEVFERVSGATVRVDDPASLRRLFERGEAATAAAEGVAARALGEPPSPTDDPRLTIALALAPTGKPSDVSARLFTKQFEGEMVEIFEALPPSPLYDELNAHRFSERRMSQSSLVIYNHQGVEQWAARVTWDSCALVSLTVLPEDEGEANLLADSIFSDVVRPAAVAASSLVTRLGGYGRAHVVLRLNASKFTVLHDGRRKPVPISSGVTVRTWTDDDGRLDDSAVDRMKREAVRALGMPVYEPGRPD